MKIIRFIRGFFRRSIKRLKLHLKTYKSQKGQDKWVIEEVLNRKKNGFFLDLAAADGITHSNSFTLERKYGWRGICIEPNPVFYNKLSKTRKCICEKVAINDKNEKVQFRIDNGYLGGIVAEDTDNNKHTRGEQLKKATIIDVEATTLESILDKHNAPKIIDYFSLDVEGSEERIIKSFNFNKYQFNCITIERPTKLVNKILFDNGYEFVKNFKFDSFYVHSEIKKKYSIKCDKFSQIPPKDW